MSQYKKLRRQLRDLYRQGAGNWMADSGKDLHRQVQSLGGYFEDGKRGVPVGYLFNTPAQRMAAQAAVREAQEAQRVETVAASPAADGDLITYPLSHQAVDPNRAFSPGDRLQLDGERGTVIGAGLEKGTLRIWLSDTATVRTYVATELLGMLIGDLERRTALKKIPLDHPKLNDADVDAVKSALVDLSPVRRARPAKEELVAPTTDPMPPLLLGQLVDAPKRRLPLSQYARLRRRLRDQYRQGADNWIPAPSNKALLSQLLTLGGYFEDGKRGVPVGYLFNTAAERRAAQAALREAADREAQGAVAESLAADGGELETLPFSEQDVQLAALVYQRVHAELVAMPRLKTSALRARRST